MAQTVTRVCSSLTQTVPSVRSLLVVAGQVVSGDTTSMCGDASPIGGHFGGFFFGTVFTPDINDAGDVLFFCDVNGGDSRRALFLYQAASGQIVKVAAVGDPSPIGGTFGAVGPAPSTTTERLCSLRRRLVKRSTATYSCGTTAWSQRWLPRRSRAGRRNVFRRLALRASASRTERLSPLVRPRYQ